MLIVLRSDASASDRARVVSLIESLGFQAQSIEGVQRGTIAIVGNDGRVDPARFSALPGVEEVIPISRPYRMVAREWRPESTIVQAAGRPLGQAPKSWSWQALLGRERRRSSPRRAPSRRRVRARRAGAFKPHLPTPSRASDPGLNSRGRAAGNRAIDRHRSHG
jgi:3-deoxy-7-phosphoheptulonate synthase